MQPIEKARGKLAAIGRNVQLGLEMNLWTRNQPIEMGTCCMRPVRPKPCGKALHSPHTKNYTVLLHVASNVAKSYGN